MLYYESNSLNSILIIALHTGIFLTQTCADLHNHQLLMYLNDYTLAPAMICRLPKLCTPSHFWVACCSKTVSTSQDIAAEKDRNSAEALFVLKATFPLRTKQLEIASPKTKHILSAGHSERTLVFGGEGTLPILILII